jgi:ribonuclease HI
MEWGTE